MTFTFTAVVKATAAKFNFASCSRHAKCSFRVRLHTKNLVRHTTGRRIMASRVYESRPIGLVHKNVTTGLVT
jgi:hypothetical protein